VQDRHSGKEAAIEKYECAQTLHGGKYGSEILGGQGRVLPLHLFSHDEAMLLANAKLVEKQSVRG